MSARALEVCDGGVRLRVRVQPKASRNAVVEACVGYYRLALTAPPVEGAANAALIKFLAKTLSLRPRHITLIGGAHAREKVLRVEGIDMERVRTMMDAAAG